MNIIVCIKQVPDTNDIKINPKTGTLIRDGVPSIVNPEDKCAVEEAVRLKEKFGGKVTAITMGPPQSGIALREVYALGVDKIILLSDRVFAGADTWATSYTLGMAIKKIENYDIIFCGRQAIDGDTAQVGPQVAEFLGIPQVTYARKIDMKDGSFVVERALEDGHMTLKVKSPVLITVIKDINKPRYPNMGRIISAFKEGKEEVWDSSDIKADVNRTGLDGSLTQVLKTFAPESRGKVQIIEGENIKQKVSGLVNKLKTENIIG